MAFLALHWPLRDNLPFLLALDHGIEQCRSLEDGLTRQPCGRGPLSFGEKQLLGNLAEPEASSILGLQGWGLGGMRPTEPLG